MDAPILILFDMLLELSMYRFRFLRLSLRTGRGCQIRDGS